MTVEEMRKEIAEYDKSLPVVMHLGDTLESVDSTMKICGVVGYCIRWKEIARQPPKEMCGECTQPPKSTCKLDSNGIGQYMTKVLEIAGDWNWELPDPQQS